MLFALCHLAEAQQPTKKIPRIVLTRPERSGDPGGQVNIAAFLQGLRELGYIEGTNVFVEIYGSSSSRNALMSASPSCPSERRHYRHKRDRDNSCSSKGNKHNSHYYGQWR